MKSVIDIFPEKVLAILNRVATNPFTGEIIKDEAGKTFDKLDKLTIAALQLVANALGIKAAPNGDDGEDPMEEFRRILREQKEHDEHAE